MELLYWLLLVTSICALFCVLLTCYTFYYLFCAEFDDAVDIISISARIKTYCCLSCVSFCCSCIAQIVFLSDFNDRLLIASSDADYDLFIQINIGLTGVAWACGEYFLYVLFVTRLYETYSDSMFRVNQCICWAIIVALQIFLMLQIVCTILGLCTYHAAATQITPDVYAYYAHILERISATLHVTISLTLVYMFVSRLVKLFLMGGQGAIRDSLLLSNTLASYDELMERDRNSQISVNMEHLLYLAIKQTLLSLTAIISSQIFFNISLILVHSFHHLYQHLPEYKKDATANFIMLPLDCVINVLMTFLSFRFKPSWYRCLCGCCHNVCNRFCSKYINCRLRKEYDKLQRVSSMHTATAGMGQNPSYFSSLSQSQSVESVSNLTFDLQTIDE